MNLSPDLVLARVNEIRDIAGDGEVAHSKEDDLWRDVLRAIAEGTVVSGSECARVALLTQDIEFERWCA
jgi:hypothetical protein